jgi:hypothetical protein
VNAGSNLWFAAFTVLSNNYLFATQYGAESSMDSIFCAIDSLLCVDYKRVLNFHNVHGA